MRSLVLVAALAGCRDKPPAPPVRTVSIVLAAPGATPDLVETSAVIPVEQAVGQVAGVVQLEARIEGDHAVLLVGVDREIEPVMHELQHAVAGVQLPPGIRPELRRTEPDAPPIVWLALHGDGQPLIVVSAFARDEVERRLERLPGVGRVEAHGLAEPTLIVWPDLDRVAASGLSLFEVIAALQATNATAPEGLGEVLVKAPVRLGQIARIELGLEREPAAPALAVHAQTAVDRDAVLHHVRDELAKIEPPHGITLVETRRDEPPAAVLVATLTGPSNAELHRLAGEITREVRGIVLDPPAGQPEKTVVPDRDRAAALGVPMADIHATLHAIGGHRVAGDLEGTPVMIKLPPMPLEETVAKLAVRARGGGLVALTALIEIEETTSHPILRIGRQRAIRISVRGDRDATRRALLARRLPPGYVLR